MEPTTIRGSKILIKVGDGADPETFAHPCLINTTRSVEITAQTTTIILPDCDDQDAVGWQETDKTGLSAPISGEGVLDLASVQAYYEWAASPDPKNVEIEVGGSGGVKLSGAYHLTSFSVSGERTERVTCSLTLESTKEIAIAAIA